MAGYLYDPHSSVSTRSPSFGSCFRQLASTVREGLSYRRMSAPIDFRRSNSPSREGAFVNIVVWCCNVTVNCNWLWLVRNKSPLCLIVTLISNSCQMSAGLCPAHPIFHFWTHAPSIVPVAMSIWEKLVCAFALPSNQLGFIHKWRLQNIWYSLSACQTQLISNI